MQKRLFWGMSLALALVIALMGALSYQASREGALRQVDGQLTVSWELVQDALRGLPDAELPARVMQLGQPGALRITVIDREGRVLGESDSQDGTLSENHLKRAEIQQALSEGEGRSERFSATEQQHMRYYARLADSGLVIRVAMPVQALNSFTRGTLSYILIVALASILLMMLFVFLYARGVMRPLTAWADWAHRVANDPMNPPAPPEAPGSQLSEPIRLLVSRLSQTVLTLSHQTSELDAILSGMSGGLIALGEGRAVQMMNRQAKDWFSVKRFIPGTDLLVLTQQPALDELLNGQDEVELQLERRALSARWVPIEGWAGALSGLIWLEDMSEQRSVEMLRREFAANVTHELKTPLTAIQGAVDSLRAPDLDEPGREKLLSMIEREVGWLSALMSDLLTLSRVESMYKDFDVEELSLADVVNDVLRAQTAAAREKDVKLEAQIADIRVMANYARLRQLIGNLVDNGVKYNRPGGSVTIGAWARGETLHLGVSDTGIGIPKDKVGRVFERFYRVDASHSRAIGGTGLGLSIVKHIVKLYAGKVSVISSTEGATFEIELPIVMKEGQEII